MSICHNDQTTKDGGSRYLKNNTDFITCRILLDGPNNSWLSHVIRWGGGAFFKKIHYLLFLLFEC
jgi:hypothetical protein